MGAGTAQAAHADGLANGQDTLPPDGPGITRTGSAPPLVPSASTSSVDSSNSLGFNLFASPTSEQRTGKERAVLASEDYLRFYYAHKNINPRLPPPIASRDSWRAKWLPRQGSADGFQEAAGVLSRSADSPFSGQGLPEGLSVALSLPVEPVAPFRPKQVQAHHLSADGWYGESSRLANRISDMGISQQHHPQAGAASDMQQQQAVLPNAAYSHADAFPAQLRLRHGSDRLQTSSEDGRSSPYASVTGHDSSSHPGTPHSRASHHEDLQLANGHLSALSVGSTSSPRYTGAVGDPPSILQHQRSGGSLRQLQSGLSRTSSMDPAIPMPHSPALSAPRVKVERGPSKLAVGSTGRTSETPTHASLGDGSSSTSFDSAAPHHSGPASHPGQEPYHQHSTQQPLPREQPQVAPHAPFSGRAGQGHYPSASPNIGSPQQRINSGGYPQHHPTHQRSQSLPSQQAQGLSPYPNPPRAPANGYAHPPGFSGHSHRQGTPPANGHSHGNGYRGGAGSQGYPSPPLGPNPNAPAQHSSNGNGPYPGHPNNAWPYPTGQQHQLHQAHSGHSMHSANSGGSGSMARSRSRGSMGRSNSFQNLQSPQRRQPPMHGSEVQPSQPQLQPAQHPQQVPSVTPASPGQVPALNMFPLGMYIPPQVLPGQQAMPQHPGAMYPPGYIMPWMMPSFHPGMMPMFGAPPTSPFAATLQQTGATNSPPVAIPIPSFTPEQAAYYQRFMEAHQAATLAHQMGNPAAAAAAFAAVAASPFGGDAAAAATAATAATLASQQPGQASSNSNNNHMTNNNNNRAEDGEGDSRDGGAHRRMRSTASAVSISSLTTSSSHPASCREQGDHDRGRPQHDTRADRDHQRGGKRSDRFRNAGSRWDDRSSGSPPVSVLQNSVLEDFKSRKSRRYELKDIAGNAFDFCRDQHGSRFLQQKLETAKSEEITALFKELQPRLLALMTDVFGNYVVQKILEYGDASHHQMMADQLRSHVMTLALQMYGCRVIQKSLEVLSLKQQCEVARELEGHVMRCVRDQNGNHVIQKCIERIKPTDRISFIIQSVQTNMVALACHPYGCRVVQRVLEHCTDEAAKQSVLADSAKATLQLAQDQYGNYVIQHILEHGPASYRSEIIGKLQGRIVELSQHKFASNVVEKCLQHGSPAKRQLVVTELLGPEGDAGPLQAMMKDQFANYVVQKMLEVCDDAQRATALAQVQQHLAALKKLTYGKHIMARLEKLLAAGHAMQKDNAECLAPAAVQPPPPPPPAARTKPEAIAATAPAALPAQPSKATEPATAASSASAASAARAEPASKASTSAAASADVAAEREAAKPAGQPPKAGYAAAAASPPGPKGQKDSPLSFSC